MALYGWQARFLKNRNYNTYEKIPKNKNYMGLYGWQARFWAISLDFSAAPGNHLQSQTCYICLLYPPLLKRPQHNVPTCCSSYVRLYVKCSLFNESESPPFCPGWPWRPCEWGSNEPSTSSQMMSTPLRRFLEWFIKAPIFAPLTPCSKFKQTITKNVKYTDRIYDETCSPPDFRSNH